MAEKQQPWGESPTVDTSFGERQVGAFLLIADIEKQSIANRRARGREPLEFRRFAEQIPTHEAHLQSGVRCARAVL
jgi:hypothetical protein